MLIFLSMRPFSYFDQHKRCKGSSNEYSSIVCVLSSVTCLWKIILFTLSGGRVSHTGRDLIKQSVLCENLYFDFSCNTFNVILKKPNTFYTHKLDCSHQPCFINLCTLNTVLWEESLNSDGRQFHKKYKHLSPKIIEHMTLGIQVLAWDRHKNVEGLNPLWDSILPSPFHRRYFFL